MSIRKLFLAVAIAVGFTSCGALEKDSESKDDAIEVGDEIEFSGFVQRAFSIKVEGVSFNDSEHFYTRFIPDLIMANEDYKEALSGAEIEIEGEYGLERFGSNVSVFMSSEAADGHLFQSKTDNQGKFTVKVEAAAQDDSYKARVVLRIGLQITHA